MTPPSTDKALKSTAVTVGLFYALIAFEFFYMATPFAAYFYGAYLPGLEFLSKISPLSGLTHFFLPHFTPSSSLLVSAAEPFGIVLAGLGLMGFVIGAVQIYSGKLRKKGAASVGVYRFVCHPQYASLILAGVGMLLIWPRFLVVLFFVTMVFVYRGLAAIEERECLEKYGESYADYLYRTPRFLPFRLALFQKYKTRVDSQSKATRRMQFVIAYLASISAALILAAAVRGYVLSHLFALETQSSVLVSLTPLDSRTLERIMRTAEKAPRIQEARNTKSAKGDRFINYVMPWEWAMSEIPMNGAACHETPKNFVQGRYKVVFTRAVTTGDTAPKGLEILKRAYRTEPVAEVWIDLDGRIAKSFGAPDKTFYGNAPVPVF